MLATQTQTANTSLSHNGEAFHSEYLSYETFLDELKEPISPSHIFFLLLGGEVGRIG